MSIIRSRNASIFLNLDRALFEKTYALAKAVNLNNKVAEVLVCIDGEEFEATFDALVIALRTLKKTPTGRIPNP